MKALWRKAVVWKLAIFKAAIGFFIVTGSAALAATDGVEWSAFTATQKFRCCLFVALAGFKAIEMFLDQTTKNLEQSGNPLGAKIPLEDTAIITKQDIETHK